MLHLFSGTQKLLRALISSSSNSIWNCVTPSNAALIIMRSSINCHVLVQATICTKLQRITTKCIMVVCQSTSYSKLSLEFELFYLCNRTTSLIISSLYINDHNPKLYMYPIKEQRTWHSACSLFHQYSPEVTPENCAVHQITQNKLLDSHLYTYKNRVENSKWTITYMCLTSMMLPAPCKLNSFSDCHQRQQLILLQQVISTSW